MLETRKIINMFDHLCYHNNDDDFHGNEAKKKIFKTCNFQKLFMKISGIGPWVSRID